MTAKREGMLTSLARKVGTTAGVIVAKTTHLKDEVAKMGKPAGSPLPARAQEVEPSRQGLEKKTRRKKAAPKKQASRTIANREKRPKKPARRVLKGKGSDIKKVRRKP